MKKTSILLMAVAVFTLSCKDNDREREEDDLMQTKEETMQQESEPEERDLFNGEDLQGWKAYNSNEITQWQVEDGAIAFTPAEGQREGTENIITEEEYTNFELSLEWKISEGGNSGIMWGVQEEEQFNEPYLTGPEIQVLDNKAHPDAQNGPIRQAGALYDMVEPSSDVTKPAGEWNTMVLRIDHTENKGSVTLNGTTTTEFPLHGEEWDKLVQNSKFSDWEDFGKHRTGHIALQDHSDKVWYRNIKIRELEQ
ncbi:DUF1080 domain-containing protein [Antarcticibacterium flavum]|uniref:DUF1080 domain-containing protein n=1 Tax=Antarcticibacterium flavum TaxID=2058175 RepID=A0A5B7X6U6_9FLAO|nr:MULTISPECIES: DUF1080 domain-containing protein [Antarcticibacterium]MCM4160645.1 DUF1080 domain-containing protein [Antarcticibacterium sp. W02-3]QCY71206.1 DUF1080 domain-containing protein [Antarcticibacterium flavum]